MSAPIDAAVARYGDWETRAKYEAFLRELESTPFAVGTIEAGMHAFVIAFGAVYELHWTAGSDNPGLYQVSKVGDFFKRYSSAVVAVPKELPTQPEERK